ncbi:MAG: hypothetical protein QNL88_02105 [Acidobacteriota bacterium]|nr:hypothetical protein [Acidobacteriota bacterium]
MKSVFFWSEEQARAHRTQQPKPKGLYLSLRQSAIVIQPIQSILFGFETA